MKDFTFSFPTQVVFGHGAEQNLGRLAAPYGPKVLILYGSERIRRSGLLPALEAQLAENGLEWVECGGIQENPVLSKAEEACRIVREEGVTLLLAVGGGSVIDTAKAVSLGALYDGPLWSLYQQAAEPTRALPIGVVLTMAATASEANCVSVLRNDRLNQKLALTQPLTYPKFALMNPELTFTVPPYQTAAGSVDIFAHSFERYFHKGQEGTLRSQMCAAVMRTVIEELPKALAKPDDYDARSQLMWASTVSHSNMLGFEGDFACHALSHVLTGAFELSHGTGLGILMPAWCAFQAEREPEAIAQFARLVWQIPAQGSVQEQAQAGVRAFRDFVRASGLPVTLREAGCGDADPEKLAQIALPDQTGFLGGNFRRLHYLDVVRVLELARG